MNLISQIFLIILIACFTGTVSLGFWRVFQPLLLKRDPRLVYATLRFVCMMYIVPFGYLIVRLIIMCVMWRGKVHYHIRLLFLKQENTVYLYRTVERKMYQRVDTTILSR